METTQRKVTILQPDDWHVHLREGPVLKAVVESTARVFARAVVMPNLVPPITTIESAICYRDEILAALPKGSLFQPLMTAYLTENLSSAVLERGHKEGVFFAAKLYPANSTTNSSDGVKDIRAIDSLLQTMQRIGLPLLIHGEVTDPDIDIFDREAVFIDRILQPLLSRYPEIRVVLEHITTEDSVQFVEENSLHLAATITPHHLQINRNSMFSGGLRSDYYCLPVAKRERHRIALRKAATSGKSCFFLGTDSAPHLRRYKESSCGCAGIFNAPVAIESYADVFDEEGALDNLEAFASRNGPEFYKLPLNTNSITLVNVPKVVPSFFEVNDLDNSVEKLLPFHAGEKLGWSLCNESRSY